MGRTRPERLLDELINELQTIETMSCLIERTETPPFFRVTSLRKASSHWGESGATGESTGAPAGGGGGANGGGSGAGSGSGGGSGSVGGGSGQNVLRGPEDAPPPGNGGLGVEKGTIHTKRHSSEDPALLTLSVSGSVCNPSSIAGTSSKGSGVCSSPRLDRSRSHTNDESHMPSSKKVLTVSLFSRAR